MNAVWDGNTRPFPANPIAYSPRSGDNLGVMNARFIAQGTVLALVVVALAGAAAWILVGPGGLGLPLDPMPPHPTIDAELGTQPTTSVGLLELALYDKDVYHSVGCSFIFRLKSGEIVGATTAHSLSFEAAAPLQRVAFEVAGRSDLVVEFDQLWGPPGWPRSGEDMTVDYVLLRATNQASIDPALILTPDPRGLPQPGERVSLYSGLGDGRGGRRVLSGTVQSASTQAFWVVMDDHLEPSGLSGSPFVSQHTGQVVGMVIATTRRSNRVLLGAHPIGSLVRLAESATEFPKIADYRR